MYHILIEHGPVEIERFSMNSMMDFPSSSCKLLPEGKSHKIPWNTTTFHGLSMFFPWFSYSFPLWSPHVLLLPAIPGLFVAGASPQRRPLAKALPADTAAAGGRGKNRGGNGRITLVENHRETLLENCIVSMGFGMGSIYPLVMGAPIALGKFHHDLTMTSPGRWWLERKKTLTIQRLGGSDSVHLGYPDSLRIPYAILGSHGASGLEYTVESKENRRKTIGKWWFNGDLMGFYGGYPLVNKRSYGKLP